MPPLQLVVGNGDVVASLEALTVRAKAGEVIAVGIAFVTDAETVGHEQAWNDAVPRPWAQMVAATAAMQHDMLSGDGI